MNEALTSTNALIDDINSSPQPPSPPISRLPLIFFNTSNDVFDEVVPISNQVSAVNRTASTIPQIDSAPLARAANQVADYAGLVPSVQVLTNCSLVGGLLTEIKDTLCVGLLNSFNLVTTGAFIAAAGLLFSIPVLILGNKRWHGASKSVTKYGKGGVPVPVPMGAPPLPPGPGGVYPTTSAPGSSLAPGYSQQSGAPSSYGYSGGFYANSSYPGQIFNEEDESTQPKEDQRLINSNSMNNNNNASSGNMGGSGSIGNGNASGNVRASASLPRDTTSGSSAPFIGRDLVKLPPIK